MTTLEALTAGKYVALTTFRRDGTPVPTPVWFVREGDFLLVTTQGTSGKVKRIRNNPHVLLAPCDSRGRTKADPVPATAALADPDQTQRITRLVAKRYGILGRILTGRGDRQERQGLILNLSSDGDADRPRSS